MNDVDNLAVLRERARAAKVLPPPDVCRALRKGAGVSVPELAEAVGVTRQAVNLWEAGKRRPTGVRLERYIAALEACRG